MKASSLKFLRCVKKVSEELNKTSLGYMWQDPKDKSPRPVKMKTVVQNDRICLRV
jgi:hypothetical protein